MSVDAYTVIGSTSIDSQLGSRPTGKMALLVPSGVSYRPVKGSEVRLFDSATDETAFGGIVYESSRDVRVDGTRFFDLTLTGFEALADRRRMFGTLTNMTSGEIVVWIIANYLAEFGITAGTIEAGSANTIMKYNGQKPAEGLNELAKNDGYTWSIDYQKRLHYMARESNAAPFDLSDSYQPVHSLKTVDSLDGYYNRVFFRGSQNSITESRTESIVGDGARREFQLRYKAASGVSVKVNGVAKTVGIRGLSSGKDFYWKEAENIISQDDAGTILTSGDTLAVTYVGYYPLFVQFEDAADIAARAAAESNSGLYETMEEDTSVQYLDMALDKVETLLRQNAFDKVDVSYTTDVPGLRAGMVQSIALTDYEVDTTILITSVTAQELTDGDLTLRYTVSGVSGERADDWMEFYRTLAKRTKYEAREGEVIAMSGRIEATCVLGSSVTYITKPAGKWDDGTSKWDGGAAWW